MIARSLSPSRPIPFTDPLHEPAGQPLGAVRWTPPSPPQTPAVGSVSRHLEGQCSASANDHRAAPIPHATGGAAKAPATTPRGGGPHVARTALARYDGPHSLSVRSSATGRHYRFPQQGATQVIDAADIALMRRIEDITIL